MELHILGPLEIVDGDLPVELEGDKQRSLLAMLALRANEPVTTDTLIDQLWEERPPSTATKAVQVHVSRLRKVLAAQGRSGSDWLVVTRGNGYELRIDPDSIDSHRFERLIGAARADLEARRPEAAVATLERALFLWRGPPLVDFSYLNFAQTEITRLNDLHLAALEELIEAKLALGRHAEVVEELNSLVAEHPYRERLRAELMLALYRCDRQADALQAYQDARRVLTEELGIEPGNRLRELEAAILRQDAALALPARRGATPEPRVVRRGRSRAVVLGLVAAAVAAGVAIALTQLSGHRAATPGVSLDSSDNSIAALDGSHRQATFAVPLPGRATDVAAAGGVAWVSTVDSGSLTAVDASRRAILRTVPLAGRPDAVAVGFGSIWVADGAGARVFRIKPGYETVQETISLPPPQLQPRPRAAIAAGAGAVWVSNGTRRLTRIEATSGRITQILVGRVVNGVAASGAAVWALSTSSASVVRVDPRDNSVTDRIPIVGRPGVQAPSPVAIAATPEWVWVLNANTGSVTRVDASNRGVVATIPVGFDHVPNAIAAAGRSAWVANGDGTLSRVDAANGTAAAVRVGGSLERVATDGGRVWVTTAALDLALPGGKP